MRARTVLIACLVLAILFYASIVWMGARGSKFPQLRERARMDGASDTLVVFMHGLRPQAVETVMPMLEEAYPRAHVLTPTYYSSPFSNADPNVLSARLIEVIDRAYARHRYQRVVLVGHSAGGALIRKAFVWASGVEEDRSDPRGVREWSGRVERIVMLAGLTRGWSVDPAPEQMSLSDRVLSRIGLFVAKVTGTGKFLRSLERGAPFVANLRLQWIRLARGGYGEARKVPLTVQLLGGSDDVVSGEDMRDVQAAKDFIFMPLGAETGHRNVAEFVAASGESSSAVEERRDAFSCALTCAAAELLKDAEAQPVIESPAPVNVVFIRHGIRDFGHWVHDFESEIATRDRSAVVDGSGYAYFGLGPFLLFNARQKNVREFVDAYTEHLARYPRARFGFIGHSNGTYLLVSALKRYRSVRFDRAVLVGSVAPIAYDWPARVGAHQIAGVVNLVGSADWVVGIFPRAFELVDEIVDTSPEQIDIGAAGFRGFSRAVPGLTNVQFAPGGHGAGFGPERRNRSAIVAYVLGTAPTVAIPDRVGEPSSAIDVFSRLCLLIWLVLIAAVFLGGLVTYRLTRQRPVWAMFGVASYAFLILIVLRTV